MANPGDVRPQDRDAQCPRRGPALSHTQDISKFADGRCVHCQVPLTTVRRVDQAEDFEPLDVARRLEALGLMPAKDDDPLVEPKMITGNGPDGPTWGKGRGPLSIRDQARLGWVAYQERRRGVR